MIIMQYSIVIEAEIYVSPNCWNHRAEPILRYQIQICLLTHLIYYYIAHVRVHSCAPRPISRIQILNMITIWIQLQNLFLLLINDIDLLSLSLFYRLFFSSFFSTRKYACDCETVVRFLQMKVKIGVTKRVVRSNCIRSCDLSQPISNQSVGILRQESFLSIIGLDLVLSVHQA